MQNEKKDVNLFTRLIKGGHVPDILDCIANLSSDEVFTPPDLVDKMLDLFPEEIWRDSSLKWLDPACKTGIFLRQIAKRLMVGLRNEFPDEEERREHIFHNMLYGIALTDLTALMSRRSLYTSKNANGEKSIAKFETANGNISYDNRAHTYKNGTCIYCGNKEGSELDRDESRERHAYNFIHLTPEEVNNMKFDVIVGNPPYQLSDGGNGASAAPIYHFFIRQAKKLNPRYMAFIVPSRWFAGGKGLDDFRDEMLHDRHIKKIVDYPDANDCFPGVSIEGGVNYFVWEKKYDGDCEVVTIIGNEEMNSMHRALHEETIDKRISSRKPFGLPTNFTDYDGINNPDKYKIYANKKTGYVLKTLVVNNVKWASKYKVLVANAYGGGGSFPNNVISRPLIAEPESVCTETYMVAGLFNTVEEAENLASYIRTRFFRFLLLLRKSSQHMPKDVYSFIPDLPMNQEWTDEKLYERYGITTDEQEYIKSMVKEM